MKLRQRFISWSIASMQKSIFCNSTIFGAKVIKLSYLATVLLFCTNVGNGQLVDGSQEELLHKYRSIFESEINLFGQAIFNLNNDVYDNVYTFSESYQEVSLEYTVDKNTNLSNLGSNFNFWTYQITFSAFDINDNPVLSNKTLTLINDKSNAVWVDKLKFGSTVKYIEVSSFNANGQVPKDIRITLALKHLNVENGNAQEDNIFEMPLNLKISESYSKTSVNNEVQGESKVHLQWNAVSSAVFYEVAYIYVDKEEGISTSQLEKYFDRAIFLETDKNWIDIDVTYPEGDMLFKVRPVRYRNYTPSDQLVYPSWATAASEILSINEISTMKPHEKDHNWSFSTDFIEDGKYKKAIEYYDNSMRKQQSTVFLNSENLALVADTDYDAVGRESISILPTPKSEEANNLFFQEGFNLNQSGVPYSYEDHDKSTTNSLGSFQDGMGAGTYWSDNNGSDGIHRDYLDNANGFPFTKTNFTRDATGRIESQTGIGLQYHEEDKTTKYYYANPTNSELESLFGEHAGAAKYYKKTYTKDPNGQVSASITDIRDKVVATSLIGLNPDNVIDISDEVGSIANRSLDTDHLITDNCITSSNNYGVFQPNQSITLSYSFVKMVQDLSFPDPDCDPDLSCDPIELCYSCPYELEITVFDPCGDVVSGFPFTQGNTVGNLIGNKLPNQNFNFDESFTFIAKEEGIYKIEKKLCSIFRPEQVEETLSNLIDIAEITTIVEQTINYTGCDITCVQICENNYGVLGYDNASDCVNFECSFEGLSEIHQEIALLDCNTKLQTIISQIKGVENEADLSTILGGDINTQGFWNQTFETYKNEIELEIFDINNLQYFYRFNGTEWVVYDPVNDLETLNKELYLDPDNTSSSTLFPADVNGLPFPALFNRFNINNVYQDQFAELMAYKHREYCEIEKCRDLIESSSFDRRLNHFQNFIAAYSNFSGIQFPSAPGWQELIASMQSKDPFFNGSVQTQVCDLSAANNAFTNLTGSQFFNLVGIEFAIEISSLGYSTDFYGYIDYVYNEIIPLANSTSSDNELIWRIIVANYILIKNNIIESQTNNVVCNPNCNADKDALSLFEDIPFVDKPWEETDIQDFIDFVKAENIEGCQARLDFLEINYGTLFNGGTLPPSWEGSPYQAQLISSLQLYCETQCPLEEGSAYASDMFPDNVSELNETDYPIYNAGGSLNDFCNIGFQGDLVTIPSPSPNVSLGPIPLLKEYDNSTANMLIDIANASPQACEPISYTDANRVLYYNGQFDTNNRGLRRLVIHNNNCDDLAPDMDDLGVAVFIQDCVENNSNIELVNCNVEQNIYGDLIVLWQNRSPTENDLILIYSKDDSQGLVSAEFYSNYSFEVPEFYDFSNFVNSTAPIHDIHIKELQKVHNTIANINPTATENQVNDYLSTVWDCEKSCGIIDPCLEELITHFKTILSSNLDLSQDAIAYNFPGNNACYDNISLYHSRIDDRSFEWYFQVDFSNANSIFDAPQQNVIFRFITEDAMTPNLFACPPIILLNEEGSGSGSEGNEEEDLPISCNYEVEIIDHQITNRDYTHIEKYDQSVYNVPKIKFLFKTSLSEDTPNAQVNAFYQTAYLMIGNKANQTGLLVDPCEVTITFEEIRMDCIEQIETHTANLVAEEIDRRIAIEISKLEEIECLSSTMEALNIKSKQREHHYTLYYYDQVGNVVKTVPPMGVILDNNGEHKKETNYNYNSFNQIVNSTTPDAGLTEFYYDDVQRLRFSQNADQNKEGGEYSYNIYDELNRVIEVGEVAKLNKEELLGKMPDPSFPNDEYFKLDIVRNYYSSHPGQSDAIFDHGVSRNRIVASKRVMGKVEDDPFPNIQDDNVTLYSYDIHGNVKQLRQYIGNYLAPKDIHYEYDLVSGSVSKLIYNPDNYDEFYYKYFYDEDNRLEYFYSSKTQDLWEEQAKYDYYIHGPLARVELGDHKVQGCDYVYTLQGWIKTMNMPEFKMNGADPGKDGVAQSIDQYTGRDASSYALHYNHTDYNQIGQIGLPIIGGLGASSLKEHILESGLYNGNIVAMVTDNKLGQNSGQSSNYINAYAYQYDQLHRIKNGFFYRQKDDSGEFTFLDSKNSTSYIYDADGNMRSLFRYDTNGPLDFLNYEYIDYTKNNKLKKVIDEVAGTSSTKDIEGENTYDYDQIGNLITDYANGKKIAWDVYNKVRFVEESDKKSRSFTYDAAGNRVSKDKKEGKEFIDSDVYVRDAQGNTLSTYKIGVHPFFSNYTENQSKVYLYGSNRIGSLNGESPDDQVTSYTPSSSRLTDTRYEESNHLGNVLATLTARPLGIDQDGDGFAEYNEAEVITRSNYYPFGQEIESESYFNTDYADSDYLYGFNGKEKDEDSEWGNQTNYDYGFRIYNPSIAKFLSIDPLTRKYPFYTPYQFAGNKPVLAVDIDGLEPDKNPSQVEKTIEEMEWDNYNVYEKTIGSFILLLEKFGSDLNERDGYDTRFEDNLVRGTEESYKMAVEMTLLFNLSKMEGKGRGNGKGKRSYTSSTKTKPQITYNTKNLSVGPRKKGTVKFGKTVSRQKIKRHLSGSEFNNDKGYFDSYDDAQKVLDSYNSGNYRFISENTKQNQVTIEVLDVTGTHVSKAEIGTNQVNIKVPTNIFTIQSSKAPKPIPVNPSKGL